MTDYEIANGIWELTWEYDEDDSRDDEISLLVDEIGKCGSALRFRLERLISERR